MYINIIHHKKIHPRIPSTTLVLEYVFKFSNFVIGIFFVMNILHTFKFFS